MVRELGFDTALMYDRGLRRERAHVRPWADLDTTLAFRVQATAPAHHHAHVSRSGGGGGGGSGGGGGGASSNNKRKSLPHSGRTSSEPCRNWNAGRCSREQCKYQHHCTHCSSGAHRDTECDKATDKKVSKK